MKIYIKIVFLLGFVMSSFGQITFNGCHPLFDDQDYIFTQVTTDATGRNVFTTIPVDGEQTCGGIGICEFMIAWNDTSGAWEFIADDGNGDFSAPFLIYSNTSASTPNPPSLLNGTWEENLAVTSSDCGGDLTTSNATFVGDVQNPALGISEELLKKQIHVYPNPAKIFINIETKIKLESVEFYDLTGKAVLTKLDNLSQINISRLDRGLYFMNIKSDGHQITKKIMIE